MHNIFKVIHPSMSTYITQYPLVIEILKYVDLHHPWVHSKCFIWIWWLASSMCSQDPLKYADLHYPWVQSKWSIWVWWLTSPMGAIKYASFEYADLQKYVNLHHPVSFTYWNPEVCWLASSMCDHDPMKYADLHHPFVLQILWSMLSYITFILLWFLKSWHNRLV